MTSNSQKLKPAHSSFQKSKNTPNSCTKIRTKFCLLHFSQSIRTDPCLLFFLAVNQASVGSGRLLLESRGCCNLLLNGGQIRGVWRLPGCGALLSSKSLKCGAIRIWGNKNFGNYKNHNLFKALNNLKIEKLLKTYLQCRIVQISTGIGCSLLLLKLNSSLSSLWLLLNCLCLDGLRNSLKSNGKFVPKTPQIFTCNCCCIWRAAAS